jgi:hypothetical protein
MNDEFSELPTKKKIKTIRFVSSPTRLHTFMMTIRLRDVSDDDLPIFFEQQREPDANQMAAFPARDRDAFMAHWTKILGDRT